MSYDEPDALEAYAAEYGVTFPLLSDPDSEIIERFGILNTLVEADDHPWYGIPFPGSYVIDADGIITAKFFEANLAFRANADELLRAAKGEEVVLAPAAPTSQVTVDVAFDGTILPVGILRDLVVTFRVPEGQHLYGEPVPEGTVATSVTLDEIDGLIAREPKLPPTETHTLAGTGEMLHIFEGDVVVRVPITHNGSTRVRSEEGAQSLQVSGTIRWQACDDDVCHLPKSERFELTIPLQRANAQERHRKEGSTRMDFRLHFARMLERNKDGND